MRRPLVLLAVFMLPSVPAHAQTIGLGGALDLNISGEFDFEVEFADEDFGFGEGGPREWFFNQDHEITFEVVGTDDRHGIEYGFNVQLELDGSGEDDAQFDEAWSFYRGHFGEFRLGDEDAVAELLAITASDVSAGTDGVDGDLRTAPEYVIADSGEATKIIYITPSLFGATAGISYAINDDDRGETRGDNSAASDIVNLAADWEGEIGGAELGGFAAVVFADPGDGADDDRATNWAVGGIVEFRGIGIAGYYGDEDTDFAGDDLDGRPRENFFNLGIGGEVQNIGVSFNFQHDNYEGDVEKQSYIVGVTVPLLPGVALRSDVAYQEQDLEDDDIDGINALVQVHTEF